MKIDLQKFTKEYGSPYENTVWGAQPIRRASVEYYVQKKKFQEQSFDDYEGIDAGSLHWHEQRVAYLVVHGWDDPIDIDFGVPGLEEGLRWDVVGDGNHRVAAALVRGDRWIEAECSGDVDLFESFYFVE